MDTAKRQPQDDLWDDQTVKSDISLCNACYCMTKTVDGNCGKCGAAKDQPVKSVGEDELRQFLRKRITNISTAAEDDIIALIAQEAEKHGERVIGKDAPEYHAGGCRFYEGAGYCHCTAVLANECNNLRKKQRKRNHYQGRGENSK